MDWKTAGIEDFLALDRELGAQLPEAYREGTHLSLLYAILHSPAARTEDYHSKCDLHEMAAFRFIRDHGDLPLTPETVLAIYGAMQDGAQASWKTTNAYIETGEGFYVTESADDTPAAMERLCEQYTYLDHPEPSQFDDIFKFILQFICIHPFEDGNGRMSALLLQFLLQKAGLACAVYLPLDLFMNGIFMRRTSREIRRASGVFIGMKPFEYDHYISFMKEMLARSYQAMLEAM